MHAQVTHLHGDPSTSLPVTCTHRHIHTSGNRYILIHTWRLTQTQATTCTHSHTLSVDARVRAATRAGLHCTSSEPLPEPPRGNKPSLPGPVARAQDTDPPPSREAGKLLSGRSGAAQTARGSKAEGSAPQRVRRPVRPPRICETRLS